jgi:hypothetical protein
MPGWVYILQKNIDAMSAVDIIRNRFCIRLNMVLLFEYCKNRKIQTKKLNLKDY